MPNPIDARLDRLTERHEALAQSLELLAATVHEQSATVAALGENMTTLLKAAQQDGENIRALARIAELHENAQLKAALAKLTAEQSTDPLLSDEQNAKEKQRSLERSATQPRWDGEQFEN